MAALESQTLGDLAQSAIAKYLKQAVKREDAVLADTDPEELHQMRVAMRRLRTALQVLQPIITVPKAGREPRVADVARQLGELRDLDVTEETLRLRWLPDLPADEQTALLTILDSLADQRHRVFKQVKHMLKGDAYSKLKKSLKEWSQDPQGNDLARLPATFVLPDLIMPLISRLWLHPGWLVGTTTPFEVDTSLTATAADALLEANSATLHSLRKQIKRVRYQLKLISEFYGEALDNDLDALETMQETLGQLQDAQVLAQSLETALPEAPHHLPTLYGQLSENRHQAWQHWQTWQQTYLNPETRHHLRQVLLSPQGYPSQPNVSDGAAAPEQATTASPGKGFAVAAAGDPGKSSSPPKLGHSKAKVGHRSQPTAQVEAASTPD